jgi:hypothetical protein
MNQVRNMYLSMMMELANTNPLQDIIREITGNKKMMVDKIDPLLALKMIDAEYFLS